MRRRWATAQKLRLVEETRSRVAKIADIARGHDVHPNLLYNWRRQAQAGALAGPIEAGPEVDERVRFAAVAIAPEPPALPTPVATSAGVVEIEFSAWADADQRLSRGFGRFDRHQRADEEQAAPMIPVASGAQVWLSTRYTDARMLAARVEQKNNEATARERWRDGVMCS